MSCIVLLCFETFGSLKQPSRPKLESADLATVQFFRRVGPTPERRAPTLELGTEESVALKAIHGGLQQLLLAEQVRRGRQVGAGSKDRHWKRPSQWKHHPIPPQQPSRLAMEDVNNIRTPLDCPDVLRLRCRMSWSVPSGLVVSRLHRSDGLDQILPMGVSHYQQMTMVSQSTSLT